MTRWDRALLLHTLGLVWSDRGEDGEAAAALRDAMALRERLVKDDPENLSYQVDLASTWVSLGGLAQKAGRTDGARQWWHKALPILERAARERPDDARPWVDLGNLYADLGRDDAAAAAFENALARFPRIARDRLARMARSVMIREMVGRSEPAFAKLLQRHPEDGSLWTNRGRYYALRSRWDEAARDFARGVASAPPNSLEWFQHACLRCLIGDRDGYRQFVLGLVQRYGDTTDAYTAFHLARTCALSPDPIVDPGRILRWAEFALGADKNSWVKQAVGLALYRAGRYGEAAALFEQWVRDYGGVDFQAEALGVSILVLAMAQQRLGDTAKARAGLEDALRHLQKMGPERAGGPPRVDVNDWLADQVFLREAEALILDPIFPADPFAY
jgi:tetratricopeptide (TPR) repeat protein